VPLEGIKRIKGHASRAGWYRWARHVIADSPCVLFRWRPERGRPVASVSENATRFGYRPEDLMDLPAGFDSLIHPDDLDRVVQAVAAAQDGEHYHLEYRLLGRSGQVFWVQDRTLIIRDAENRIVAYHGILIDITEQKRAERALQEQQRLYRIVAENASDVVGIHSLDGTFQYVSPSAETVLGHASQELLGSNPSALVAPEDLAFWRTAFSAAVRGQPASGSYRLRHGGGAYIWVETVTGPIQDETGAISGVRSSSRDITQRKVFEDQLAHQAFHDPLTDLPNRALFIDRLRHALARSERRRNPVAVLFLDLDRFKLVNDSLGHAVGDQLLIAVGQRLQAVLRPEDTVARLGGDEFTLLLEDIAAVDNAIRVAERVLEHFAAPIEVAGHEVYVSTSIGIAMSGAGSFTPDELVRNADVAQYLAKQNGAPRFTVYDPAMNEDAAVRIELEADLRRAISRGELLVYYQPLVRLDTGRIVEVEALVRWQHPQRGMLTPVQFIPMAEETGLIHPVGEWVLTQACAQAALLRSQFPSDPPLVMAVNLSAKQLQQPGLVTAVAAVLRATGLQASGLKLELTETAVMQDPEGASAVIRQLRDLGIHLAIDDFGTGYSSLSYIANFLVDTLKIDRTFIARLGQGPDAMSILQTIMSLARSLNLTVTGEGVETDEQLGWLRELGCDRAQGYLFARPMPSEELVRMLATHGC